MNQAGRSIGGSRNGANIVVNPFRSSPSDDRVPSRDETPRSYKYVQIIRT